MTANENWAAAQDGLLNLASLDERTGSFSASPRPWQLCARTDLGMIYQYDDVAEAWVAILPLAQPAGLVVLPVFSGALSGTTTRFVPPRGYRLRVDGITVLSDDATTSDGSNNWSFQLYNRTQSDEELFATDPTTNGGEITANTVWRQATDQNQTITADDVLELVATLTGSPGNLDHCLICVEATMLK